MGLFERVYDKSPIFLQNLMVSISGYKRNKTRYGKAYSEHREFLIKFDEYTLGEKLEYQEKALIELIKYAYENSKFYRDLYSDVNIETIKHTSDITKLPVVDKEMIRANIKRVNTISKRGAVELHTGGTTGKSLEVLMTPEDMMKRMAMLDHFKSRVGFEHLKMKRATFNGKHIVPPKQRKKIFWRYNAACKQMIYSSFHLTEDNMKYYVESLNKFKPQAIDGFFMSMCDVANYIERNNIQLSFKPKAIFPTSETLTEDGRDLLERTFKAKVYDQYASAEGAPFITECINQKLHIELSTGVFELYSEKSNEILVSSFTTHGTPLIRYRIGDSIFFNKQNDNCKCGNSSPLIDKIIGRRQDFLYNSEGTKIYHFGSLFNKVQHAIIRTQLCQDRIGEVEISLEIDKSLYLDEYNELIITAAKKIFGYDCTIKLNILEEIQRESSGKFRMIKNNVNK